MKKFHSFSLRRFSKIISTFLLFVYSIYLAGCSYYNVNTMDPITSASITKQVKKKDKYIIIHFESMAWHLSDIVIDDGAQVIKGTMETLPENHMYYKTSKHQNKPNRYRVSKNKIKKTDKPIHEIHLYLTQNPGDQNAAITIPFTAITKVEVYDTHVGATILSVLGVSIAVGVVVVAIIAATKSSCPFVYINNGETYAFTGEMYGGAIYSSLERDDYMPLPGFNPIDGKYQLRVSNELLERQFTNLAHLIVIDHPNNSKVLLSKDGGIQTITEAITPLKASAGSSLNIQEFISGTDSVSYLFDEPVQENCHMSELILSFKKPGHSTTGKLILNAKNSHWLDFVYGKFTEQFGTYFNTFCEDQKQVPAQQNIQWTLDQGIPLSVYIETENGWEFVDYFNSMGPLASRDLLMPIDLRKVKGETVKIKLECGFMFWEVDYAAMDFSKNIPITVSRLSPSSAVDENNRDVSASLAATDDHYLVQPDIGNVATIEYNAPAIPSNMQRSTFFQSRGYYEYIRDYKNSPDWMYLRSFKEKGAFTEFAKEHYNVMIESKNLFASTLVTEKD